MALKRVKEWSGIYDRCPKLTFVVVGGQINAIFDLVEETASENHVSIPSCCEIRTFERPWKVWQPPWNPHAALKNPVTMFRHLQRSRLWFGARRT